jgi:hypothetical protein
MTTTLPAGIITSSDSITGNIEQIDVVDAEDIARLWKGMSAPAGGDRDELE